MPVPVPVLLVEDMLQLRGMVKELLQGIGGFQVVGEASTEAEAKLWIEEHRGQLGLAIVDLILDQGTGMGVIAKCKEEPGARVVVFSDYATPGIRDHCLKLGADAVFQKSTEVQAFVDWCARLVAPTAPPN